MLVQASCTCQVLCQLNRGRAHTGSNGLPTLHAALRTESVISRQPAAALRAETLLARTRVAGASLGELSLRATLACVQHSAGGLRRSSARLRTESALALLSEAASELLAPAPQLFAPLLVLR